MVTEEDFLGAQRELIPSVSAKELEHYARVRAQFESVGEKDERKNGEEEVDGKGKGKANGTAAGAVPEWQLPRRPKTNGRPRSSGKGKGKGKMKEEEVEGEGGEVDGVAQVPAATNGFQVGRAEDDEDLY
jgi:peroxin-6